MWRRPLVRVKVRGWSMSPALPDGATVWASALARPKVGFCGVVPAPTPDGWVPPNGEVFYIKRIRAIGPTHVPGAHGEDLVVPEGTAFLQGDNPLSLDSRQLGPCPLEYVLAVTIRRHGARTQEWA